MAEIGKVNMTRAGSVMQENDMSAHKIFVLITLLASLTAPVSAQDTSIWEYNSGNEDIGHFEIVPSGALFLSQEDRVRMLEPDTGAMIWERTDIRDCEPEDEDGTIRCRYLNEGGTRFSTIPGTDYGLFEVDFRGVSRVSDRYAVVDLSTGETIWDSRLLGIERTRGFLYISRLNQFLLGGETPNDQGLVLAVNASDGGVLWQQDIDYLDRFKFIGAPTDTQVLAYGKLDNGSRVLVAMALPDGTEQWRMNGFLQEDARNRNALLEMHADGTSTVYMTKDGPFRLNLTTGEAIWRVTNWDEDPPLRGAARMIAGQELLFVPNGRHVRALHLADGSTAWQTRERFDDDPVDMRLLPEGLLIRSEEFALLDDETGESLWPRRAGEFDETAPIQLEPGAVYVADEEEFWHIDLATGNVERLAEYDFENERPGELEANEESLLLMSRQNLLRITRAGNIQFHTYLKAPGGGLLGGLSRALRVAAAVSYSADGIVCDECDVMNRNRRYGALAVETFASYFIYTDEALAARDGFSLVRLDKVSGSETGRLWLDERNPNYVIDEVTETVFFQADDSLLTALRFETDSNQ